MAEDGTGRSILKWGCFGCLGCLGVVALLVAVAVGVGWLSARNTKLEDQVVARDLPRAAEPEPEAPPAEPAATAVTPASTSAGRVILDLSQAEFHVQPGEPGGKVRVEASYDKRAHELEESLDEPPQGPWVYRIRFRQIGGGGWLRGLFAPKTSVSIYLPPDVPLELELDVRQGGAQIELGGLWLTTARISTHQGGGEISVSEPLHAPMERFELSNQMGGMSVRSVGNASPAHFVAECSMGGMALDLRGAWVQDATIELDSSMGGLDVRLPRDLTLRGVPGREPAPGTAPEPEVRRPILTFSVDPGASKNIKFR